MRVINIKDKYEINELAFYAMGDLNFYRSQKVFERNAQLNPCFLTYNNLGYFYAEEGRWHYSKKIGEAKRLGIKYLKKAEKIERSYNCLMAIGDAYFDLKKYKAAIKYYSKANNFSNNYISFYNLGVCYYKRKKYFEASNFFKQALDNFGNVPTGVPTISKGKIFISYAFSVYQFDRNKFIKIVQQISPKELEGYELDEFTLWYLSNDFDHAIDILPKMFEHWSVDTDVMAMVFDVLIYFDRKDEAIEHINDKLESLEESSYNTRAEQRKLKKLISNAHYREKVISKFYFARYIFKDCYCIYEEQLTQQSENN